MLRWLLSAVVLLGLVCGPIGARRALAQDGLAAQAEVDLSVASLGVGGVIRPGGWAGIAVELTERGVSGRDVVLRVSVDDPDGDRANFERVVTTNPGVRQRFWLYAAIPAYADDGAPLPVSVFEAEDSGGEVPRAGRMLARVTARLGRGSGSGVGSSEIRRYENLIGVINDGPLGLQAYQSPDPQWDYAPLGHEASRVIAGMTIADLPDRWQGLAPYSVLVWGSTTGDRDPLRVRLEQARALDEWVRRGGHLVIVLPAAGREWLASESNPLADLLPDIAAPRRREAVAIEDYAPLLRRTRASQTGRDARNDESLPGRFTVHTFEAADDAEPGAARPVLAGPNGQTLAIRRNLGAGAVTLIGIDLNDRDLVALGLPDAESFWHRVIGRRGRLVRVKDLTDGELSASLGRGREDVTFESDIASRVAKTGRAAAGLLLGVVVFAVYWIVAGPGGYLLLKRTGRKKHAWAAFLGVSAVFTAIAWTGATAVRPKRVEVKHLSLIEHVHGQDQTRSRAWAGVLLPMYGDAMVSLAEDDAVEGDGLLTLGSAARSDLLAPWSSSGGDVMARERFPDNRAYRVEAREPDSMDVPARATVKQFRADRLSRDSWGMPEPVWAEGDGSPAAITLERDETGQAFVRGQLTHSMPGAARDLLVLVVERPQTVRASGELGDATPSVVRGYRTAAGFAWDPQTSLDLEALTHGPTTAAERRLQSQMFDRLLDAGRRITFTGVTRAGPIGDQLAAVRLLSMLDPPDMRNPRGAVPVARRLEMHMWDLGRWLTEPCVIVMGVVEVTDPIEGGGPVPFEVNGRVVPSLGTTHFSWIYPLPPAPPAFANAGDDTGDAPPSEDEDGE